MTAKITTKKKILFRVPWWNLFDNFFKTLHIGPGGGTPHIKGVGMLVGNFELKETDLGVAQALFDP